MKNKKLIIIICFFIFAILGCFLIFKIDLKNDSSIQKAENIENIDNNKEKGISNIQEQVIENESSNNTEGKIIATNGFEFNEKDLKEKLGIYLAYENFMNDYFVPEQELENANIVDYANEAKVFIGYFLVLYSNPLTSAIPTEEQVRKAVEEFCGEHYEKYIDTTEYWLAFDGDNSYEFVSAGDYNPTGYCNSIESIIEQDGKYTVTFIYSRPREEDYIEDNLENNQKFRKSMTFIYHEDAIYTKYQLTELSFIKGEEV